MNPLSNQSAHRDAAPAGDCRCLCGSLLARLVAGGVELKCRRCKRTLLVPVEPGFDDATVARPPIDLNPVRKVG